MRSAIGARRLSCVTAACLVLAARPAAAAPAPQQSEASPSAIRAADVNGTRLHYVDRGQGPPVVFVHGSLGDLHTWDAQVDAFAREFRVIAYSRRYHPPNDPPQSGAPYSVQRHADDLAALIEHLGLGPAHLVASSYGAYVALALALQHPQLVRSLVLGEPPVMPLLASTSVGRAVAESFRANVMRPSRDAFQAGNMEDGLRRFLDGVIGQPGRFDQLPEGARKGLMDHAPEMRLEMLTEPSSYMPQVACGALAGLERPVLLVTGERSGAMFLLITTELERCLEGESHVMVPGAGHAMHAANAAFYNGAVMDFLRAR